MMGLDPTYLPHKSKSVYQGSKKKERGVGAFGGSEGL